MEKPPDSIRVTKLDAARRQLETAVRMWFQEADPISIHTLSAASNRIILDLLNLQGKTSPPFDILDQIKPEKHREIRRLIRKTETFFKHAKDDPHDILDFNVEWTEFHLFATVEGFKILAPGRSPILDLFDLRFRLLHPNCFAGDISQMFNNPAYIERLRQMSPVEFFNELFPEFVRASN